MVSIGILGLGSGWDDRYRPALENLKDRIHVAVVYDGVFARAQLVAKALQAQTNEGMLSLCRRHDVQAVLLLDPSWTGIAALEVVCEAKKPFYVAAGFDGDEKRLRKLHELAAAEGRTFMPELSLRHTPAANRLQELFATQLGRPHQITIQTVQPPISGACLTDEPCPPSFRRLLVEWSDWCSYMLRCVPTRVAWNSPDGADDQDSGSEHIRIDFSRERPKQSSAAPNAASADVFVSYSSRGGDTENGLRSEPAECSTRIQVVCERGIAVLESGTEISWQVGSKDSENSLTSENSETCSEILASERSEVEVTLDHFCRRVVGGLVPVPDLNDVCRGMELVRSAERSRRMGQPVRLTFAT